MVNYFIVDILFTTQLFWTFSISFINQLLSWLCQGLPGASGSTGASGLQGVKGMQGARGDQGATGHFGEDVSCILFLGRREMQILWGKDGSLKVLFFLIRYEIQILWKMWIKIPFGDHLRGTCFKFLVKNSRPRSQFQFHWFYCQLGDLQIHRTLRGKSVFPDFVDGVFRLTSRYLIWRLFRCFYQGPHGVTGYPGLPGKQGVKVSILIQK